MDVPVVGMIGAGQLARMTHQAAVALGQSLRVLAASPADPAALVARDVVIGDHRDLATLRDFAKGCHVVTFDHEHVPIEHVRALVADGVDVRPGPGALPHAQDKLVMRRRLAAMGVPAPPFAEVTAVGDALAFGARHGWPCVLKAARGGYDGRGVWMLNTPSSARRVVEELLAARTPLLVEQCVPMRSELAAVVARSPFGQAAAWPVVETVQRDGICVEVLAPAPGVPDEVAVAGQELALRIAHELDVVGVLAVELFRVADHGQGRAGGRGPDAATAGLLVNELAMRPHNSAHWTIEGSRTSQFEQHLRAVLDYPLGSPALAAPVTVMANVLGASSPPRMSLDERLHHLFARYPDARVHVYGKAERPGRKIGHVNVVGRSLDDVRPRARAAAAWLSTARWPDGWDPHG